MHHCKHAADMNTKIAAFAAAHSPIAGFIVQFFIGILGNVHLIKGQFESILEAGMAVAAQDVEKPPEGHPLNELKKKTFKLIANHMGEKANHNLQAGLGEPFTKIVHIALPDDMSTEEKDKFMEMCINKANELFAEFEELHKQSGPCGDEDSNATD